MSITRNDVARRAGVSSATVSYVVNNGPRPVSKETKQKVLNAIAELGYHPSAIARSLKIGKTTTIGVVVTDILNPVLSAVAKGVEDAMLELNYNLIICNSDENPERELIYLGMLIGKRVDGVILMPTGENIDFLRAFVESKRCPLVLLDRQLEELSLTDCVMFDNEYGTYQAIKHLIDLGHRRIALVNLPHSLSPGFERAQGYLKALNEAGIPIDRELIMEGSFKAEEATVLAEKILSIPNPPTAIFTSSNRLLTGVLKHVKNNRIKVPEDLALCVFDDIPFYSYITPSITAVATDLKELGHEMANLLEDQINCDMKCDHQIIRVPCELKIRESTIGIQTKIAV